MWCEANAAGVRHGLMILATLAQAAVSRPHPRCFNRHAICPLREVKLELHELLCAMGDMRGSAADVVGLLAHRISPGNRQIALHAVTVRVSVSVSLKPLLPSQGGAGFRSLLPRYAKAR